jgi:hypothetical protein
MFFAEVSFVQIPRRLDARRSLWTFHIDAWVQLAIACSDCCVKRWETSIRAQTSEFVVPI